MQSHKKVFVIAPLGAVETKGSIVGGLAASRYAAAFDSIYDYGVAPEFCGCHIQPAGSPHRDVPGRY